MNKSNRQVFPSVASQIASSKSMKQVNAGTNSAYPGDVHSLKDNRSVFRPTTPGRGGLMRRDGSAIGRLFAGIGWRK